MTRPMRAATFACLMTAAVAGVILPTVWLVHWADGIPTRPEPVVTVIYPTVTVTAVSRSMTRLPLEAPAPVSPPLPARATTSARASGSQLTAGPAEALGKGQAGPARTYAAALVDRVQFGCLDRLWERESHWNPLADNPASTAYGIAQLLTETSRDYRIQIRDGLAYIESRYGSSCLALSHSNTTGWY